MPLNLRFGYRRVHIMLRREGWQVGKNVVYRLYREEGLCLRTKRPRRRKMAVHREAGCMATRPPALLSAAIKPRLSQQRKADASTPLRLTICCIVSTGPMPDPISGAA